MDVTVCDYDVHWSWVIRNIKTQL